MRYKIEKNLANNFSATLNYTVRIRVPLTAKNVRMLLNLKTMVNQYVKWFLQYLLFETQLPNIKLWVWKKKSRISSFQSVRNLEVTTPPWQQSPSLSLTTFLTLKLALSETYIATLTFFWLVLISMLYFSPFLLIFMCFSFQSGFLVDNIWIKSRN